MDGTDLRDGRGEDPGPEGHGRVRQLGVAVRSSASESLWLAQFTGDLTLRPSAGVAAVVVGDQVVLAHEGANRPVALDPVSSVLWSGFDGRTTLQQLAEDVAAAHGGTATERVGAIRALAASLVSLGLLDGPPPPDPPSVRAAHPPIDPTSCAGKRLGLGRTILRQVAVDGRPLLRYGSSVESFAAEVDLALAGRADLMEVDASWVPTVVLRASPGRGRRLQQLFGTLAQPRYATTDLDEAGQALLRTVSGMVDASRAEAAYIDAPVLVSGQGAVLLHPAFHEIALGEARVALAAQGFHSAPSALARLLPDGDTPAIELPAGPNGDPAAALLPLDGVLVPDPGERNPVSLLLATAHLAHRWDQVHLDAAASIVTRHPHLIRLVPQSIRDSPTTSLLDALTGSLD